ncbi:hypothetical protein BGX20_007018, partial [Mortierella sp. AD010]
MILHLFCVLEEESNEFPVEIESTKTVGHLKKLIKTDNPETFNAIDAKDLIL